MLVTFTLLTFPYKGSKRDPNSYVFLLVVSLDGTPGVGTTYQISFVNVGKTIASSLSTYIILGAEFPEDSDLVSRYISKLTKDLVELEKCVPCDCKWCAISYGMKECPCIQLCSASSQRIGK